MRRLAVFVEGYTELLFVDRMIKEIASKNQIAIQHRQIRGGGRNGKTPRTHIEIFTPEICNGESRYVLIVDCGGDQLVAQRIREEHAALTRSGYEKIVGIRDVYPEFTKDDIPRLRQGMMYGVKTSLAPVQFVLSVMEIEAWFIAEYNHFPKIDPAITVEIIRDRLGFDPTLGDLSDRLNPAGDISSAYGIGGKAYEKGAATGTIDKLDYAYIYADLCSRIPDLGSFLRTVDRFLA